MSQPKSQLETFRAWAGKDSDIRQAMRSGLFWMGGQTAVLILLDVGTATTSHRTTSTYAVGSFRERQFRLELLPALPVASLRESPTIVSPRPRIPSRFLSTGSPSRARGTAELQYTLPPGPLQGTRVSTAANTSTTWQKRFVLYRQSPHPSTSFPSPEKLNPLYSRVKSMSTKPTEGTTLQWTRAEKLGTTHSSERRLPCDPYGHLTSVHFSMKYSPSESGHFDGQRGYGYISIEKFVDAARSVNAGTSEPRDYDKHGLPTIENTVLTTAILNAGRISLDEKRPVDIKFSEEKWSLV